MLHTSIRFNKYESTFSTFYYISFIHRHLVMLSLTTTEKKYLQTKKNCIGQENGLNLEETSWTCC